MGKLQIKINQIENSYSEKQSTSLLVSQKLQEELQLSEKADEKLLQLFKVLQSSANNLRFNKDNVADECDSRNQSYDVKDDIVTEMFKKLTGLTTDVLNLSKSKSNKNSNDESK